MARTRKIKVHAVNLDVDETQTHWLVYVSPQIYAQGLGISPHRARLPRCRCMIFSGKANRCRWCGGWSDEGMARYVVRLLRSYPKQTVEVPAEPRAKVRGGQRMPGELRWAGAGRGWVAV